MPRNFEKKKYQNEFSLFYRGWFVKFLLFKECFGSSWPLSVANIKQFCAENFNLYSFILLMQTIWPGIFLYCKVVIQQSKALSLQMCIRYVFIRVPQQVTAICIHHDKWWFDENPLFLFVFILIRSFVLCFSFSFSFYFVLK